MAPSRARLLTIVLALGSAAPLGALGSGCKPKAGGACKIETKETCTDDKQALACHDGKWEPMPCRGASGCTKQGSESVCDQSVAEEKDVCNLVNDFVCSPDKKGMLECVKNHWAFSQACLGDLGCTTEAKKVVCDNSFANVGDVCREEDDYACGLTDKKAALVCKSGKFVLASQCRGKNACKVAGNAKAGFKVECDDSIAVPGDACDKELHYSCTPDEKQIVRCVNKKYVADDKCTKNQKCAVKGELVGCY
ncbi:MAG: hypothetical protein JWP97_4697 [Labilithrix sp.]|nr:hypothetical protein [Labilithrix sp.]